MQDKTVILTGPQADLCRAVLCQELMKVSQLLARDQDASGSPLDDEGNRSDDHQGNRSGLLFTSV